MGTRVLCADGKRKLCADGKRRKLCGGGPVDCAACKFEANTILIGGEAIGVITDLPSCFPGPRDGWELNNEKNFAPTPDDEWRYAACVAALLGGFDWVTDHFEVTISGETYTVEATILQYIDFIDLGGPLELGYSSGEHPECCYTVAASGSPLTYNAVTHWKFRFLKDGLYYKWAGDFDTPPWLESEENAWFEECCYCTDPIGFTACLGVDGTSVNWFNETFDPGYGCAVINAEGSTPSTTPPVGTGFTFTSSGSWTSIPGGAVAWSIEWVMAC